MKKRDRRLTPTNTSLIAGWDETVSREITSEKMNDTASAILSQDEGTLKEIG
jgi:hypothetical protein